MTVQHESTDVIEVRHMLSDWDPLGYYAANGIYPDEYEPLIQPILTRLSHTTKRDDIVAYLDHELHDHFGKYPDETLVVEFADRLLHWYAERG
ncbi:hypothetical protein [Nocardioides jejuensis]|uniref:DUF1871 family protein n=1 Tax=Nocardioides jejuensis TaxID=2502782 RepID=A0A4R1C0W8_9ACTN|nr:hypothetical protein [Nocardioides jejuensis]TCJ24109.1 hypothetical protein EPD65_09355 [Nocardioides jejuensis]